MFDPHSNFASLVNHLVGLINLVIPLLMGVALAVFFAGLIRYIYHASDAKTKNEDRELLWWGLIALFVLVSIWGILGLMSSIFAGSVPLPTGAGLF